MRQHTIFFMLCFTLLFATTSPDPHPAATFRPNKDHAILFAVNTYKAPLTTLSNPITNARQIASELETRFGFKPQIVENPTSAQIEAILRDYTNRFARNLNGEYPSSGQLFIFFSGHGTEQLENGFFLPADADMNNLRQTSLQYSYLRPLINAINCQHILVAVDACYSVTFDEDYKKKNDFVFSRPGELSENDKILANHEKYKSRVFFTSDAVGDMTPDKSGFAKKLLEGLRTFNAQSGFMTSSELFANFLQKASPTPHGGEFGDDEAGSTFLFFQQEKPANLDLQSNEIRQRDIQAWKNAQVTNTPAAYLDYLQKFLQGAFREEASKALNIAEEDQAWELARLRNTPDAYQAYITRYPAGRYTSDAKKNLQPTVAPDSDRDGIPDANDRCPDLIGPSSNNGCPTPPLVLGMVLVQGGIFQMGDVMGDKENDNETVHNVTVSSFLLAKNELTFDEFDAFCMATARELPSDSGWGRGKRPVINVDWYDAVEYCNWRSSQEGLQVVYSINKNRKDSKNSSKSDAKKWLVTISRTANGYRLPTEAEWEYTAREGGRKVRFGNGKDTADLEEINFDASSNFKERYYTPTFSYYRKTIPVGSFLPNTLEFFDMSGNVLEWCGDWYGAYPSNTSNDPQGPTTGSYRVMRGGSYYNAPSAVRVAARFYNRPDYSRHFLGFRLARAATTM